MKHTATKRLTVSMALILLCFGFTTAAAEPEGSELFPAEVQTLEDGTILKTYILTEEQNPSDIPRETFERDGWRYTLTDITEQRTSDTETRYHTESVEFHTESGDMNEIVKLLAPTLDYQASDGLSGTLTLDLASVKCEAEGYKNSNYTVSATREYPHLSANDLSFIPKTITDNGRELQLEDVSWEVQQSVNVDYQDIPESYRAIATYTAKASRKVVTGYITTASYTGEITKTVTGSTVYTAHFAGKEINPPPSPKPSPTFSPASEPPSPEPEESTASFIPIIMLVIIIVVAVGGGAYFFLRRNVRIYRDNFRVLAAKDKISASRKLIDLSPLNGERFGIEIDKLTAKTLNGQTVEVRHGLHTLSHKIAYEGNAYRIEVDFGAETIQAVY